jgi:hypothetical protein
MRHRPLAALASLSMAAVPIVSLSQPVVARQGEPAANNLISVDFKGGTVVQYVETLKKSGKAVNVVTSERATRQTLAPISLKDVTVGVAVYSIEAAASSNNGSWRIAPIQDPVQQVVHMGAHHPRDGAYSVDFYPVGKRGEEVVVESYSLQKILRPDGKGEGADAKVILTAIETGLKLQNEGADQPPDLQFHGDSGLLFVRGTGADVRLVGSIVARMSEDAGRTLNAAQRRAREDAMRSLAMKEAKIEIELRQVEYDAAMRNLAEVQQQAKAGNLPSGFLQEAEVKAAKAKLNLERARLGLERAEIVTVETTNTDNQGILEALSVQNAALRKQLDDFQAATKELPRNPGRSTTR